MNIVQAIELRKSRRRYLSDPISQEKAALLHSRVEEYNLRSGLTIRFMERGGGSFFGALKSYGLFKGVRSLFIMKGSSETPHLSEAAGYYGEFLVLEATALGLGTCWVGTTFESSAVRCSARERLICVITVGNIPPEESLKEHLIYKAIHRKSKPVESFLQTDREIPDWLRKGLKSVQKAPSFRNLQRVKFIYESGTLRATVPETGKFDLVDLGIAKLHFSLTAGGRFEPGNGGVYIPSHKI